MIVLPLCLTLLSEYICFNLLMLAISIVGVAGGDIGSIEVQVVTSQGTQVERGSYCQTANRGAVTGPPFLLNQRSSSNGSCAKFVCRDTSRWIFVALSQVSLAIDSAGRLAAV
jgi:hypothetical protein